MFKIKLTGPDIINRKYVVYVDDVTSGTFLSRRAADSFITTCEEELNETLLFINEEYCTLNQFYRSYFLGDQDYKFKFEVGNLFELINNRLNFISGKGPSLNYNSLVSQAISVCLESLTEICDLIERKSRQRYDMLTRRRIALRKKVIDQYCQAYTEFKKDVCNKRLTQTKHDNESEDHSRLKGRRFKAQA